MADISKIKLNGTEYNIKDNTARGKADTAIQSVKVNGTALTPDSNKAVDITAIPASIVSAGTLANGMTATTQTTSDDSAKVATTEFVHDVVDELPEPMVFKSGMTLTADSIDTTKCSITVSDPVSASDIKSGYTYKVTTISGTYTGTIKVGDTFIAKKDTPKVDATWVVDTDWTVVPSGDETGFVVGKASGTTQNNLVKWGADGYTVDDSGIAVETSFSGTSDAKVPTSKSIKTNVADNAVLTGFTAVVTPSSMQNVASTDTITDAMEKLDNNTRLNQSNILSKIVYGTCSTAAATAAKVVDVPQGFVLTVGCIVGVFWSVNNTASNVSLNVGGTGAKEIAYNNYRPYTSTASKVTGAKNTMFYYMYDGTYWVFMTLSQILNTMAQSEASEGTSTTERLITAKVLSDTIDEKLVPIENNILIEDVTANFVAKEGYTVTSTSHVYKQGKHIFGVLCVTKNSGNYGSNENICRNSVNIPSQAIVNGCYMSGGQWQINGVGYVYMQKGGSAQSGEITITDSAGTSTHCFINLDYVTD